MPHPTLSETQFQKLVRERQSLVETASHAASAEKARGYWSIGKRVVDERISEELGYHNAILRDLARATDLSVRTLQRSVAFYRVYPKPPSDGLTWMHYQQLCVIDGKSERKFYQKKAVTESWSVRELREAIRADMFRGGQPEERVLERPTSLAYCYIARLERIVDADTLDLDVDLGFRTWTKRRIRLAGVDAPPAATKEGRAARNFAARELSRADTLVIKSSKSDMYGRYVADVFFSTTSAPLQECFERGHYLNDLLVRRGHAVVV